MAWLKPCPFKESWSQSLFSAANKGRLDFARHDSLISARRRSYGRAARFFPNWKAENIFLATGCSLFLADASKGLGPPPVRPQPVEDL